MVEGFLVAKERVPDLDSGAVSTAKITEIRDTGVMVVMYPRNATCIVAQF